MSKRPGAVAEETRTGILTAAREEFAAHGLQGSSLRRICAAAGVTTGALYFFFQGKDDLFRNVLNQVTEPFGHLMQAHYQQEQQAQCRQSREALDADFEISRLLISFYFSNRQTWDILVHHLNHPAVQTFLDTFIESSTEHYLTLLQKAGKHQPDRFAIHQFVHMQVDTMLTLISHAFSQEEMIDHSKTIVKMLQAAFQALLAEEP